MSDMLEIFSRDPLSYTKEGGELRIIIEEMRKKRAQFNLGNISAGTKIGRASCRERVSSPV